MRRLLAPALALSALALALPTGCDVEPDRPSNEKTATQRDGIYGGTADTTHDAVVWLYDENGGSACSGTIIATNGSAGYVLTAAHCTGMDVVIMADDVDDCFGQGNAGCLAFYDINQDTVHPQYNGDASAGFDFRIVRFSGANASTPVIPAASNPDGMSVGAQFEVVGYGVTQSNQNNTLRRHVFENVSELYSNFIMASQTDGTGSCSGDSGGPAIAGGKVVGVVSFGDQNCTQYGAYGRVQFVYNNFIAPIIGGQVIENCDSCFDAVQQSGGACNGAYNACITSQTCQDFAGCINNCSTNACFEACFDQHPAGGDLYLAFIDCGCNTCATECAAECGGSSSSTGVGAGPGATSSTGAGGEGQGGSGGATTSGGDDDDDDDDDDGGGTTTVTTCDCGVVGGASSSSDVPGGSLALLGLALAGLRIRSRRKQA